MTAFLSKPLAFACLVVSVVGSGSLCAQSVPKLVSGRVFLDANGNGAFDPGEKGLSGCVVSDEQGFARSDEEGRYQLTLSAGSTLLFVVNPPNTWPSQGWWRSVSGPDAGRTVDFPLCSQDQSGPLYFVQGSDPHLQASAVPMFRKYVEHVNALPVPVRFVVHTGDLVVDSSMATMDRARELFSVYEEECKGLRSPLRNVMGNHDIAGVLNPKLAGTEPGFGKSLYRERLGPATYAFRSGPYHFLVLDGTMVQDRKLVYGLTQESADWAIRYLADVKSEEPVVLLIHEPMFPETGGVRQPDTPETRPHEARLVAALQGHKLVMTLAGHVHGRGETTWAGAPHLTGGAISYAWHGLMPYPPRPMAYVLFRLENGREEHVFLDWAEELSIDIASPAFTGVVRGVQAISGVVADPQASVTAVECKIAGQTTPARTARKGNLATAFEATLDTSGLSDGICDLLVTAHASGKSWTERQPVVVVNGKEALFQANASARLSFRVGGKPIANPQVTCNGQSLSATPATGGEFACDVPATQLRGLNEIVIRAGESGDPKKALTIRGVTLTNGEGSFRDMRYAPGSSRPAAAPVVSWIDLRYREAGR